MEALPKLPLQGPSNLPSPKRCCLRAEVAITGRLGEGICVAVSTYKEERTGRIELMARHAISGAQRSPNVLVGPAMAVPSRFDIRPLLDMLADLMVAKFVQRMPATPSMIPQRLLSVEQAAQYLGRTKASIQHMIAAGALPVVRPDRRVFLDIRDLDEWILINKRTTV